MMEAIAKHDFNADQSDELSFRKDNVLTIIDMKSDPNWYTARLDGKEGMVPSNYIEMKPHDWLHHDCSRADAEAILMQKDEHKRYIHEDGAFLVRNSESSPGDFSISVKYGNGVQHYKILYDGSSKQYFLWVVKFSTINQLIEYHRKSSVSRTQTVLLKDMKRDGGSQKGMATQKKKCCRAMFDFKAEQADEIPMKKGCLVEITDDSDENWWKGYLIDKDGKCLSHEGVVPAVYLQDIS